VPPLLPYSSAHKPEESFVCCDLRHVHSSVQERQYLAGSLLFDQIQTSYCDSSEAIGRLTSAMLSEAYPYFSKSMERHCLRCRHGWLGVFLWVEKSGRASSDCSYEKLCSTFVGSTSVCTVTQDLAGDFADRRCRDCRGLFMLLRWPPSVHMSPVVPPNVVVAVSRS
jgi:hypothetical protein